MNAVASRERYLRALGVEPLHLRRPATAGTIEPAAPAVVAEIPVVPLPAVVDETATASAPAATRIRRLALQPDTAELADPVLGAMYTALSAAVVKAGLQSVRVCDVAADPTAAVLVFGTAPLPADVPVVRVLRTDPLRVLHADRERKRLLWERMQALGRGEVG